MDIDFEVNKEALELTKAALHGGLYDGVSIQSVYDEAYSVVCKVYASKKESKAVDSKAVSCDPGQGAY